ncbi:MAG TPA: acetate--CoA ligase [Flavobacteriales bacterium]|jgi:acetyl-CoA synthetase|nr:acetate--CoA ligase [Salibacteraceae bacterium]HAS35082.1 acetate--CoA ligase [Flavobacteriales bacterium]
MDFRIRSKEDYEKTYQKSVESPEDFWAEIASSFSWKKPWDQVLEYDLSKPEIKWFLNGKLNITENCLDRHIEKRGNKTALIWEPNDPTEASRSFTYHQLRGEVCRMANALKSKGIKKGDNVCLYMPMVPELAIAVLACARIGAPHSVVFAGFSAKSLADRIEDAQCKMVITADGSYRGAKTLDLKSIVDEALKGCVSVENVLVLERTSDGASMTPGRDFWLHDVLAGQAIDCAAEEMDSEDPLFILYTSGSTGKPKGIVHSTAGYMVYTAYTFQNVFQVEEEDVYWCTADIGWVTGHSYIVYGPLLSGATSVMFEGVPTWPDSDRFWEVVDKHKVSQFYTAPTAIRALESCGDHYVEKHDLSSLKVLGTVGEPINEEAWHWYNEKVGKKNCPIVDTWWQTETGGILISPIPHCTDLKPTFATKPLPGIQPSVVDEEGNELQGEAEGRLCIKFPWPSMARTIYGNHQRFKDTYYTAFPGKYFTGDGCKRDAEGNYRITGRVDDVLIVSGHNLGTAEIEDALDQHPKVCETAVVGYPHDIKGQGIHAFVMLYNGEKPNNSTTDSLRAELINMVSQRIGPIAKPDKIQFVSGLPKTRSGKIMRRILRKIAEGDPSNLGDTSTLLDPSVVDEIKAGSL